MFNQIIQLLRATINKGVAIFAGQTKLTANTYSFVSSVSTGAIIASIDDPFRGQKLGTTTYSSFGVVPDVLSITSAGKVVAGLTSPVAGLGYNIGVLATSGNGKKRLGSVLRFGAVGATPVLIPLSLSNTILSAGAVDISIIGAVNGSIITCTNLPTGLTLNSAARTITGTLTTASIYSITLVETLIGAIDSPKSTSISFTVSAGGASLLPKIVAPTVNLGSLQGKATYETNSTAHSVKFTVNSAADGDWDLRVAVIDDNNYVTYGTNGGSFIAHLKVNGNFTRDIFLPWTTPVPGDVVEARMYEGGSALYVNNVAVPGSGIGIPVAQQGTKIYYDVGGYSRRNYLNVTYGGVSVPIILKTATLVLSDTQFSIAVDLNYVGSPTGYDSRISLDGTVFADWTPVTNVVNNVAGKVTFNTLPLARALAAAKGGYLTVEIRQRNVTTNNITTFVDYPAPLKMMMNVSGGGYAGGVYPFVDLFKLSDWRIGYGSPGSFYSDDNPLQMDKDMVIHAWPPNVNDHIRSLILQEARPEYSGNYKIISNMPFRTEEFGIVSGSSSVPAASGKYELIVNIPPFGNLSGITFRKDYGVAVIPPEGIRYSCIMVGKSETGPYGIWEKEFIEDYKTVAQGLRFMDLMGGNGAGYLKKELSPANRTVGIGAVRAWWSWETMVDMCNRTNCDAYITIPYDYTDENIVECVKHFRDNLTPGLKLYVEFSNELWNLQFSQCTLARIDGFARNLAGGQHIFDGKRSSVPYHKIEVEYKAGDAVYTGYHLNRAKIDIVSLYNFTVTHTSAGANAEHFDAITPATGAWQGVMKVVCNGVTYTGASTGSNGYDYLVAYNNGGWQLYWGNYQNGNYTKFRNEPPAGASMVVHYCYNANVSDFQDQINPAWVRDQDGNSAGQFYQSYRSKQIFDMITPLYASKPDQLIRIMAGQCVPLGGQEARFFGHDVGLVTDRVALAPYFGDGVGGEGATGYDGEVPMWTKAMKDRSFSNNYYDREQFKTDLFAYMEVCRVAANRTYGAFKEELRTISIRYGVPVTQRKIMSYEGQQHLFFDNKGWGGYNTEGVRQGGINGNFSRAMQGWWQDPRLADLMERYYDGIEAQVGNEFTYYHMTQAIAGSAVQYGSWMANRYTGDHASVRYIALRNKKLRLEGVTAPRPSFLSKPSLPATGVIGTPITVTVSAANGTVFATEWSIDGDIMPREFGASFTPTKAGIITCQVAISGPGGSTAMISSICTVGAAGSQNTFYSDPHYSDPYYS